MPVLQPMLGGHISEDALELYALNRLSEVEDAAIEEHLLCCELCRVELELIDLIVEVMHPTLWASRRRDANPLPAYEGSDRVANK